MKPMVSDIRQNEQDLPGAADEPSPSSRQSFRKQLLDLHEGLKACRRCQDLFGYEPRPVQWGNPEAKIMHISQAPGKKVHEIGRPFSDLSGKRLRNDWYQISEEQFYNPDLFYFTTAGHCFPGKAKNGGDRKPPKCCWDLWTKREIELMKDVQLYLVVGSEAASRLFPGRPLKELVFADLQLNGKPCYVLPHPSPLNMNWLRDHPEFAKEKLPEIRAHIHEILKEESTKRGKSNE